ncbi:hypothetical protein RHMOL_Rhmol12G0218000 [Rhododendron molle]|uniref:Uncharacterized protein n=1 Tax=Rhododendron molle TaxID=49168 RepID=A0ACC0LM03_RHOML|nr:hypothetical protein RHMOL_Rhmol12G0218000 [Rhododendron molle]
MGDIAVDIFLETLKQLITNSELFLSIGDKHQLQSLEMEIKYLREFLKVTEKKRNEHIEVMNLVRQIRDVVFESENTVGLFVTEKCKEHIIVMNFLRLMRLIFGDLVFESDYTEKLFKEVDLESVKKEIKILTAKVKQMYDENMYDINTTTIKKLKHSFTGSSGSEDSGKAISVAETKQKRQSVLQLDEQTSILTLPLTQTIKATMCAQKIVTSRFVKPPHRLCSAVITVNGGCF